MSIPETNSTQWRSTDTVPMEREDERWAYALVFMLALATSALGAVVHGMPTPVIHDEFSYLFAAETFARFRLTNPSPPSPESFFSPHILVEPSFSAKYPPAQGLFLGFGSLIGMPVAGLWLSGALAAVALLWCARAITPVRIALVPALAFVITVLFASRWVSGFMGGLVPFLGGALLIGAFLRVPQGLPSLRVFLLAGAGGAVLALSRPFEGAILVALLGAAWATSLWRVARPKPVRRTLATRAVAGLALVVAAVLFQVLLNYSVTGNALRMPHVEFHSQYMSVPLFRWQEAGAPEKPNARLLQVENSFRTSDDWPRHLLFTVGASVRAVFQLSGWLLPGFITIGALMSLRTEPRLVFVAVLFPVLQSSANYVHFAHYFAPVAPVWYLFLVITAMHAATHYRQRQSAVLLVGLVLAVASALPAMLSGAHHPRQRRYHQLIDQFALRAPVLVFTRYAPELGPNVNVVYNDPDLRNPVLLVNYLDSRSNCEVVLHFPDHDLAVVTIFPDSMRVESDIPECPAR